MTKREAQQAFDIESIRFVLDENLAATQETLTEHEIAMIAASLFEMVPPDKQDERIWARAARINAISRRDIEPRHRGTT